MNDIAQIYKVTGKIKLMHINSDPTFFEKIELWWIKFKFVSIINYIFRGASFEAFKLGRKKIIVKVQKKHPHMGASKIRRVYEKEGISLYRRMKKKRIKNPANLQMLRILRVF
jgi:hypothetical protein